MLFHAFALAEAHNIEDLREMDCGDIVEYQLSAPQLYGTLEAAMFAGRVAIAEYASDGDYVDPNTLPGIVWVAHPSGTFWEVVPDGGPSDYCWGPWLRITKINIQV